VFQAHSGSFTTPESKSSGPSPFRTIFARYIFEPGLRFFVDSARYSQMIPQGTPLEKSHKCGQKVTATISAVKPMGRYVQHQLE